MSFSVSLCSMLSSAWANFFYCKTSSTRKDSAWDVFVEPLAKVVDAGLDFRKRHPRAAIYDLKMHDLARDPIGSLEGIYKFSNKMLSENVKGTMREYLAANRRQKRSGRHKYHAHDFGIDENTISLRFAHYEATCDM